MPRRPTTRSSDITYEPIDPAPLQKHFSSRRKSVKPLRTGGKLPRLTKSQSTLTQIGWPTPTPQPGMCDVDEVSQEPESSRPKKRRRTTSGKKKGDERRESQPSITQAVRSMPAKRARKWRLDETDIQVFRDPKDYIDASATRIERVKQLREKRGGGNLEYTDWTMKSAYSCDGGYDSKMSPPRETLPEVANSSSQIEDNTDDEGYHVVSEDTNGKGYARPRQPVRTPRKLRFTNTIPSSQSPASIKLSTGKSVRFKDAERIPLKERSGNARSPHKRVSNDSDSLATRKASATAAELGSDAAERNKQTPRQPPRTLKRVSTVQETQYDADDNVPTAVDREATPCPRPRKLQRFCTVQDSQYEDLDFDPELPDARQLPVSGLQDSDEDDENYSNNGGEPDRDDEDEGTYDPAYSALARDAARFGMQTQTQQHGPEPRVSDTISNDDEELSTDDEAVYWPPVKPDVAEEQDDDAGDQLSDELHEAAGRQAEETVPSSEPEERAVNTVGGGEVRIKLPLPTDQTGEAVVDLTVEEELIPSSPPPLQLAQEATAGVLLSDGDSAAAEERVPSPPPPLRSSQEASQSQAHAEPEWVPSSPPALRPSEVSTQMPTQLSHSCLSSRGKGMPLTFTSFQKSMPATLISVQSAETQWPVMRSSSPLPLPPWSAAERLDMTDKETVAAAAAGQRKGKGKTRVMEELGGLVDFSLPPPPPMSSSRAGTQVGGSSSPAR